jgi:hypothetical protein
MSNLNPEFENFLNLWKALVSLSRPAKEPSPAETSYQLDSQEDAHEEGE